MSKLSRQRGRRMPFHRVRALALGAAGAIATQPVTDGWRRRGTLRRSLAFSALAALLAPVALAGGGAGSVAVGVSLAGAPGKPAKRLGSIRLIDAATAQITAAALVTGRTSFRLNVAPSVYMASADVEDLASRTERSASSRLFRARAGKPARVALALAVRKAAASGRGLAGSRAAQGSQQQAVVSFASSIPAVDAKGNAVFPLGTMDMIGTDMLLAAKSAKCSVSYLANARDRGELQKEIELQRTEYVDPSTRVTPRRVAATHTVNGAITQAGSGLYTATLAVTDVRTGARQTVTASGRDVFALLESLGGQVARDVCSTVPARWTGTASGSMHFVDPISDLTESWTATFTAQRNPKKPGVTYDLGHGNITWSLTGTDLRGCRWSAGPLTIPIGAAGGGFGTLFLSPTTGQYQFTLSPGNQNVRGSTSCPNPDENGPFFRVPSLDCGAGMGKWQPGTARIEATYTTDGPPSARCTYRLVAG